MAQQQSSNGTIAGITTILGLGLVWWTVATSLPSQEQLFPAPSTEIRQTAAPSLSPSAPPALDLTIPTSPPMLSESSMARPDDDRLQDQKTHVPFMSRLNPSALQATRLKCEANIEQLCPDSPDGAARTRCLRQRVNQLPPVCQSQLHERFVKWKEDRSRLMAACNEDVKRFCRAVQPGSGQILQCLQSHDQKVSDRCYQTLPKDTFFFR
jgi:Cysteine rich repeat